MPDRKRLKIAVIGGGISGIMSSYLLQKEHDITIFEANDYLGGHAHPVKIDNGSEPHFYLDTAFLVFNNISYPLFIKFIKELGVYKDVAKSEMSFSFSDHDKDLYFAVGKNLSSLFYQKENIKSAEFYNMFKDLIRFRKQAYSDLKNNNFNGITLGKYLENYSTLFKENMVAPTAVSVWSLPVENIWEFPAETYIRFQNNHNYLKGFNFIKSGWFTFNGSSHKYLQAFLEKFSGKVLLNEPIKKVFRHPEKVDILKKDGSIETFDKVIFATPANITLDLIDNPSNLERDLLSKWRYHKSRLTLHTDKSVVHPDKNLWASWNVRIENKKFKVTYYLNKVQPLKTKNDYFLTFSDEVEINKDKIINEFFYSHPIYDSESTGTQKELPKLNGYLNSYFCGNYFGYGFHEDGVKSATNVALKFGIENI